MDMSVVFTDVEASTAVLQAHGPAIYATLICQHRALLERAWMEHGGIVHSVEGDGTMVIFGCPEQALVACSRAQRMLAAHPWPTGQPLRVRMGVDVGEVHAVGADLIGLSVHRAARIADAAHGGQVIMSAAVAARCGSAEVLDLGEHQLRGFGAQRLAQLCVRGMHSVFPPLRVSWDELTSVGAAPDREPARGTCSRRGAAPRTSPSVAGSRCLSRRWSGGAARS